MDVITVITCREKLLCAPSSATDEVDFLKAGAPLRFRAAHDGRTGRACERHIGERQRG